MRQGWRDMATSPRVAHCGYRRIDPSVTIGVRGGRACYHGVMRCGSTWECPYCQALLRVGRAPEVRRVIEWHSDQHGRAGVNLVTLTVRHGLGHDLETVRRGISKAWRRMQTGKMWGIWKARLGVEGLVRALEVTHGPHGWHPHLHAILLTRGPLEPAFITWLEERWRRVVEDVLGPEHVPSRERGVDVRPCHNADYLAKLGLEVSAVRKQARGEGNRSAMELLEAALAGDRDAIRLYRRYAMGMKGARMLTWTHGLKRRAGVHEQTDDELADELEGRESEQPVCRIKGFAWDRLRKVPGAPLRLLQAAEAYGLDGVRECALGLMHWERGYDPIEPPRGPPAILDVLRDLPCPAPGLGSANGTRVNVT